VVVLDKGIGADIFIKIILAEGFHKETAVVSENFRLYQDDIGYG
jgi:hypothetical protein